MAAFNRSTQPPHLRSSVCAQSPDPNGRWCSDESDHEPGERRKTEIFLRRSEQIGPAALLVLTPTGGVYARSSADFSRADTFAQMSKPIVYIETTFPNFYYDFRSSEAVVTRRAWTREWWNSAGARYRLVTSGVVLEELSAGRSQLVLLRLALIKDLAILPTRPEVQAAADIYVQNKLMPASPDADAAHLALASWNNCDFIVTWNCKHLANPNKVMHLRRINERLGLRVPEIVTPLQLLRRP